VLRGEERKENEVIGTFPFALILGRWGGDWTNDKASHSSPLSETLTPPPGENRRKWMYEEGTPQKETENENAAKINAKGGNAYKTNA
jgi:hypothetical protein